MSIGKVQRIIDTVTSTPESVQESKDQSKRIAHAQIDKADFFISICGYSNGKSDVNISVGAHQIPEVAMLIMQVMQAMAEAKIKSMQLNEEKKNG